MPISAQSNAAMQKHSRRNFLKLGCAVGAGALVAPLEGYAQTGTCTATPNQDFLSLPFSANNGRVGFGIYGSTAMRDICEEIIPESADMSWLSSGDSVFIKVACSSGNQHPAVTSPDAVAALVGFLKDRGAGTIYVGDQSRVESVRLLRVRRRSSTKKLMARNGLLAAAAEAGATLHCFDDQGWDGYFQPADDFGSLWAGGIWLPSILQSVDHIICLPRLGSHTLAGYSCGIKNAVGLLRDDSRRLLHQKGGLFSKRFAEINHFEPLRTKLRLVLTLATKAMSNNGPDFGEVYDFNGCLAIASSRLVDHDYLASAILPWCDEQDNSAFDRFPLLSRHLNFFHGVFVAGIWGVRGLRGYEKFTPCCFGTAMENDRCISHLVMLQKYRPQKIELLRKGDAVPEALAAYLGQVGNGIFSL